MSKNEAPKREKPGKPNMPGLIGKRVLALAEITAVSITGVASMTSAAQAAESSNGHEGARATKHTEAPGDPRQIADKVIFRMNNDSKSPYLNRVVSGVYVMLPGTFVNTGPVAAAESSTVPPPGTKRLKKNEYDEVLFGRRVDYGGHKWLIGYENDGRGTLNAINTANMSWYNLDTARYRRYGFPDPANPRAYIKPKLMAAQMDPDANLQLVNNNFRTLPGVMPPLLALDLKLHESWSTMQSQLDAMGFKEIKPTEPDL